MEKYFQFHVSMDVQDWSIIHALQNLRILENFTKLYMDLYDAMRGQRQQRKRKANGEAVRETPTPTPPTPPLEDEEVLEPVEIHFESDTDEKRRRYEIYDLFKSKRNSILWSSDDLAFEIFKYDVRKLFNIEMGVQHGVVIVPKYVSTYISVKRSSKDRRITFYFHCVVEEHETFIRRSVLVQDV
jgi:hypothetical protein